MNSPADITAARLQLYAPRCDYMAIAPHLDAAAKAHGITTVRQVCHFLAQVHHESEGLTRLEEDLDYTAAELRETWPSHFSAADAARYAHYPVTIACRAYGGRDGNTAPLDGWTYRGRGFFQLTGRDTYRAAGQRLLMPLEAQPNLVAEVQGASATAADFWRAHNLDGVLATHAEDAAACAAIRRVINGGEDGLPDVLQLLRHAGTIWREA